MAVDVYSTSSGHLALLREFLDFHESPTVIVDCSSPETEASNRPCLIYYNPRYREWIRHYSESKSEIEGVDRDTSFKHFAEDTTLWDSLIHGKTSNVIYLDSIWVPCRVGGRWGILQMSSPFNDSPCLDKNQWKRPRKRARALSMDETSSTSSRALEPGSDPHRFLPSPDPSSGTPASEKPTHLVDWTRYDIPGSSEFVKWLRQYNWGVTRIGPLEHWSTVLRQIMFFIVSNPEPRCIYIGHDNSTMMYNEACSKLLGSLHPEAMGVSGAVWAGPAWEYKYRGIKQVLETGVANREYNHYYPIPREDLPLMEAYFSSCTMPIIDGNGNIFGVVKEFYETTTTVIENRRRGTIQKVENMYPTDSIGMFWPQVHEVIDSNPQDFPFCLIYSTPRDSRPEKLGLASIEGTVPGPFNLEGTVGLQEDHTMVIDRLDVGNSDYPLSKEFRTAWITRRPVILTVRDGNLPDALQTAVDKRGFGSTCHSVVLYPINRVDGPGAVGFLLLGLNPQRHYDTPYKEFLKSLVNQFMKSAASILVPSERERLLQARREAEAQEREFTKLAELAPVGCAIFETDRTIKYSNPIFNSLSTLRSRKDLPFSECIPIHPHDQALVENKYARLFSPSAPENVMTFEFRVRKAWSLPEDVNSHHQWRCLLANSSLIPSSIEDGANGDAASVITYLMDITPEKREQRKKLEDAMETKRQSDDFIDMTCHEVRNPLAAIIQSADIIISAYESENLKKGSSMTSVLSSSTATPSSTKVSILDSAQTILLCAQHQKRIIDDILTLSKLESNRLQICPERVQPTTVVEESIQMSKAESPDAQIAISFNVDESYKKLGIDYVLLDPARLRQILINLLINAIKFTRSGSTKRIETSISASLQPPSLGSSKVSFIPPREHHEHDMSAAEWGTGEIIFLRFDVSDTGKGMTQGEITRLFRRFSQASHKTFAQYGGSGLGLFISRGLAELQGGQIGVSSDVGEGTTFAFYIKAPRCSPEPSEDPSRSGVSRDEPLTSLQHIKRSLSCSMAYTEAASATNMETTSGASPLSQDDLHVLLVEDNLINQSLTALQLRQAGCVVHVANHGQECLEFLESSCYYREIPRISINDSAPQSPVEEKLRTPLSVILLDQKMPVMDGLTCVRKIRSMQDTGELIAHVPVIACTANARREQVGVALEAGMDEVITKPFRINDVLAEIESLLNRMKSSSPRRISD